ncbi:PqqD family protein [Streptomyces sp. NPDC102437]|uniref:PqqD family protein n=1 Tax=Streptomyces sp. NPDC102437 TaxID=3366175 RepID=UPI003826FC64
MLTPARHIHHATSPYGTAVLDVRQGSWLMLDPDASTIWRAVTVRGGTAGLADEIAVPTGQDPRDVGEQIAAFVSELVTSGVLVDTDRPRPARRGWWRR